MEITGTCRLVHSLWLYDGKTTKSYMNLLNEKYSVNVTLEGIRRLCGAKSKTQNLYGLVVTHLSLWSNRETIACRMRYGWGSASLPVMQSKSISKWIQKRPLGDDDGGNATSAQHIPKKARSEGLQDTDTGAESADDPSSSSILTSM